MTGRDVTGVFQLEFLDPEKLYESALAFQVSRTMFDLVTSLRTRLGLSAPTEYQLPPHLTLLFLGRFPGKILTELYRALGRLQPGSVKLETMGMANAHNFIEMLPAGYDTLVGDRGEKLSGGQRQRISLARALLKESPIIILDEATSSIDNETATEIHATLKQLIKKRTTIIITHRLHTIRDADLIYVLKEGSIIEKGTHDSLLRNPDGLYSTFLNSVIEDRSVTDEV